MAAVALIVIEVETRSRGMPSKQHLHVLEAVDGDAHPAHLAHGVGVVRVVADLGGQVEGHGEAGGAPARADSGSAGSTRAAVPKPAYWRMVQSRPR